MPETYEQDGQGDYAIVYLHYFYQNSHWFIIEQDIGGSVDQAYGYAVINGGLEMAKSGYISIKEITQCGAELDLYFEPLTGAVRIRVQMGHFTFKTGLQPLQHKG